jgi:protease-4
MTRWLLTAALAATAAASAPADTPKPKKPNPFDGQPAEVKPGGDTKPAADPKKAPAESKKDEEPDVKVARVAHIKLAGDLDEAPVAADPLFGPPQENLRIKLDRIKKAAKDDRVKALFVELGGIEGGFGKVAEVRRAVADFRKSGKKAFAYGEVFGTKDYLIALACDHMALPESGEVAVYGLRAEVTFYKNTLELLRLKADVLKMGAYKSAVEPFLSDKMSKENREQITELLDDNYESEIVAGIVAGRKAKKFTPEQVRTLIDGGPYTAKAAHKLGLVDQLLYEDQVEAAMAKELGVDEVKVLRNFGKAKAQEVDFSNPFALLSAFSGAKKPRETKDPKIAVVYAIGSIASGKNGGGGPFGGETSIGSETTVEAIRQAEKDPSVKAIVLRVDSPGGSALASDVIWREVIRCKKPVVASMGDVAASGGYYISMGCKKIYAEPGTITGSIGVFGLKLVTGGLEEWAGMKTEVVSRGKNSGVNSSTFPWTESEREAMTATVEEVYDLFISKALEGRKAAGADLTRERLLALAGGRIWTGRQAKANGLVDELGTLDDAIGGAKKLAGLDPKTEMELLVLPKGESFLDKLMEGDAKMPFGAAGLDLRTVPGAEKAMRMLDPLLKTQKDPAKVLLPFRLEWK